VHFEIFNSQKATWEIKGAKSHVHFEIFNSQKKLEKIKRKIWLQYVSSIFF
jgi:hypothetical protein